MKTVKEICNITGISIRTLHYYDEIDLLKPSFVNKSGYRYYNDNDLYKLQTILILKELEFSLNDIKKIINNNINYTELIKEQIKILELEKERIDNLIIYAEELINKGVNSKMKNINKDNINNYKQEVIDKYGNTKEYQEFKTKKNDFNKSGNELMDILKEISNLDYLSPNDLVVLNKVKKLQDFITNNFYTCSNEILYNLGQMYINDERFKNNIDNYCKEGAALFINKAITEYTKKNI